MRKKISPSILKHPLSNNVLITLLLIILSVSLIVLVLYISNNSNNYNNPSSQSLNIQESLNSNAVEIKPTTPTVALSSGDVGITIVKKVK